eukprot:TRINITY_DN7450_c0_g1_i3.p1 TRINITY_DN7450_c0_g1~~TRINITY_DN7450_c0_g1_i3.p1  ORF type:complete len:1387 (+),score=338.80 TRINITY_DN7450_c0_g1_i3:143-4303(+)
MGCDGSKVADENQKLRKANETLNQELGKLRSVYAKDPPSDALKNGGSTSGKHPGGGKRPNARKTEGAGWRDHRLSDIVMAKVDHGQQEGLMGPCKDINDALSKAFAGEGSACGFTYTGDTFEPPGGSGKPLDASTVARRARTISPTHPAVAAYTLETPLSLVASAAMRRFCAPTTEPFVDKTEFNKYSTYEALLHKELLSLPRYEKVAFKASPSRESGIYTPGNLITWNHPTSASILPSVAVRSLGKAANGNPEGTLLIIQSYNGRCIEAHSACPDEKEVVFLTNSQFRTSKRISSAVSTFLTSEMNVSLDSVDVLALCEVRLVVWRDVITAMDEVEEASCPRLKHILDLASKTAEEEGRYTLDIVTQEYVLGAPMTELPPRGQAGFTVVHLVAESEELVGLLRVVTHRLKPADIDEVNADGKSPLNLALNNHNIPGTVHLLRKGASAASLGSLADRALATAAAHIWPTDNDLVHRLLNEIPASSLEQVACSKIVLQAAAGLGKKSEAQPLLQALCRKAKNQQLKYLETKGMLTAACSSPNVDKELLEWLVIEAQATDSEGEAVCAAIRHKNFDIIKELKRLGIKINGEDADRRTAMHVAASIGSLDGLHALKDAGVSMNVTDSHGWTLAHEAAYHNYLNIIESLVRWGEQVDQPDVDGCTPLWWAADAGNDEVISLLQKNGANVKVTDLTGSTAVIIAAYNGHEKTVKLLQSLGADVHAKNSQGRSAVWLAAGVGSVPILQILSAAGAKLDAADNNNMCPVHIAAQEGWVEALKFLHSKDVNMNVTDNKDLTPLHYAAMKSRFECIKFLVSCGVNISARGEDINLGNNCMPLHIACSKHSFETNLDALAMLIDKDTVNAESKCGSPLDIAHMHNRYITANKLREQGGESTKQNPSYEEDINLIDNLRDVVVNEVVFRHPKSLPEKNVPGAVIKITVVGDKFTYSLNGEARPTFKTIQIIKGNHGLALKFPDGTSSKGGRQVYLPITGIWEIVAGLISMADEAGIQQNLKQELKELVIQGLVAPLKVSPSMGKGGEGGGGKEGKVKEPSFKSVVAPSDTVPYAFSRLKVVAEYDGGEEGASKYQWLKSNDGETWVPINKASPYPDETGHHYSYYATADDIGCHLKVKATPCRKDGVSGTPVTSKPVIVQWPPHLGASVVDKLVESIATTRVTCVIDDTVYPDVFLQLVEKHIKIKQPDFNITESLLVGTMDEKHNIRCILDPCDSSSFMIEGMNRRVKIQLETRVERDFVVCLIRAWAACSDHELCKKVLGGHFNTMWASGVRKVEELMRTDRIWNAFEEPCGGNLLHLQDTLPSSSMEESRQTLLTLRKGFSSGDMRRPPTTATAAPGLGATTRGISASPEPAIPDARPSIGGASRYTVSQSYSP